MRPGAGSYSTTYRELSMNFTDCVSSDPVLFFFYSPNANPKTTPRVLARIRARHAGTTHAPHATRLARSTRRTRGAESRGTAPRAWAAAGDSRRWTEILSPCLSPFGARRPPRPRIGVGFISLVFSGTITYCNTSPLTVTAPLTLEARSGHTHTAAAVPHPPAQHSGSSAA